MTVLATATLSTLMREGSQAEHRRAESAGFVTALLDARVTEAGYATYLARLRPVYAALEAVGADLARHPVAGQLVDPALDRLAAIEADLAHWTAASAPTAVDASPTAAVTAYVGRIEATRADPVLYVAHHYTRYLGDLSGGQAIGRVLARAHGVTDGAGLSFYRFDAIEKVKPYKDGYRARLDALPLADADRRRVADEVRVAFALNEDLFAELTAGLDAWLR
ncbi:MAG: biliverdin-producing heme oxygenase [Propionicimonas sp.]|uniref:biliverdin-producing heme oxygenase n=1 Tax=Propionicimonas sp. TaxID=1955623 RepID=UPI003D14F203